MDFVIGGLAGAGATIISNPIDVVKTRLQLQGELKSKMETTTRYRGMFHGLYVVARNDGLLALQKGLAPAMVFGSVMNSVRLGTYHIAETKGWTKSKNGDICAAKAIVWSSISGVLSGVAANPMAIIKTRLQATSNPSIAVGRQHNYTGMFDGATSIYKADGPRGFMVGLSGTCTRLAIGSPAQLVSFSLAKEALLTHGICANSSIGLTFTASAVSGAVLSAINCPLDLITVRLYNQGSKQELLYKGVIDCLTKVYKKEGLHGFYKGVGPFYMRSAPHTTISLSIWDMLNNLINYNKIENSSYDFIFILQKTRKMLL